MHGLNCDTCAVRNRSVCGALSREEIARLNSIAIHRDIPAGGVVFNGDEDPGFFANVISGVVKLTKTMADGRQQIVGLQFPASFLGRPFRKSSPYYAEAATPIKLCTFGRTQFESIMREFPGIEHRLFQHTLDDLDAAQEWMLLLGRKTAAEKVASFLCLVANRTFEVGCSSDPAAMNFARFDLPLPRADIADYLGLTLETVSRQISKLKARKIIVLEGTRTIIVPDIERLRQAAEEAQD